tara:strand:- start:5657 stop:6547 length:891 start_codon:yes stop_codon:yes gene_type:complete
MKLMDRIYIEISNICNLQCSFCPEVERQQDVMSLEHFENILIQALPKAKQVCLHLMGEPTAHPKFPQIIEICEKHDAKVMLTTNGTLLTRHKATLASSAIVQINFSVHSFRDNFEKRDLHGYLLPILEFSRELHSINPLTYINYRLWNLGAGDTGEAANDDVYDMVERYFDVKINRRQGSGRFKSKRVWERVYFHFDTRFEWPHPDLPVISDKGTCHALGNHIAIHSDGTVVPCCLDKEARLALGNCLKEPLDSILQSPRAVSMKEGFAKGQLSEDLCRRCDYVTRFQAKAKQLSL